MPYLDNKIEIHNDGCSNPVAKRLYIRDYDDKGKQKFVSWGLTCTTCGVILKEKFQPNPTPKQLKWLKIDRIYGIEGVFGDKKLSDEEYLERDRKWRIREKLRRLHRKRQGSEPITPKESGLRTRIRNLLDTVYYFYKNDIKWDAALVHEFLNLEPRPSFSELNRIIDLIPDRHKLRMIGYTIPIPDKPGWFKHDGKDHTGERLKIMQESALAQQKFMKQVIEQHKKNSSFN